MIHDSQKGGDAKSVSSREITIKAGTERLTLPERPADFVSIVMKLMSLWPLDITHLHALPVDEPPNHHRDPFERLLIAQERSEQMTLLTTNRVLQTQSGFDLSWEVELGWETGIEPATFGATDRRSTS
jgi:PIN domain nuclease of toxin-antitoxin system